MTDPARSTLYVRERKLATHATYSTSKEGNLDCLLSKLGEEDEKYSGVREAVGGNL